jgi:hypothetical protein
MSDSSASRCAAHSFALGMLLNVLDSLTPLRRTCAVNLTPPCVTLFVIVAIFAIHVQFWRIYNSLRQSKQSFAE